LEPTNTAGKAEQQGIDYYQYNGKLIPNNTAGNILHKKVTPNTSESGKIGSNQNRGFQPIRRENGSDKCSGKYMR
jgi:hypothetical protein